jgi:hypothetical protein
MDHYQPASRECGSKEARVRLGILLWAAQNLCQEERLSACSPTARLHLGVTGDVDF